MRNRHTILNFCIERENAVEVGSYVSIADGIASTSTKFFSVISPPAVAPEPKKFAFNVATFGCAKIKAHTG